MTIVRNLAAFVATAAFCLGLATRAQATLPALTVGQGALVTPSAALTYYQGQGLTSNPRTILGSSNPDPDIVAMAKALGNDPDKIYEWVRNNVEIEFMFGLQKGARGAMLDKSGTAFDQAHLMVELLRASGYTAQYQFGTIKLAGQQFSDWSGITNKTVAETFLGNGGIPATVTTLDGTTVNTVTLMHIWVDVVIGGAHYLFDPAYKAHTVKSQAALDTIMGFNGATFLSDAISGAGAQTSNGTAMVRDMNNTNINADLTSYSTALFNWMKTNKFDGSLDDTLGGSAIVQDHTQVRQTSLSYVDSATMSPIAFANDIPNSLRTKLTIAISAYSCPWTGSYYVDEFYGRMLWVDAEPLDQTRTSHNSFFQVMVDQTALPGSYCAHPPTATTLTVDHPYAANSGTYMDDTEAPMSADMLTPYIILNFWGDTSPDIGHYYGALCKTCEHEMEYFWSDQQDEPTDWPMMLPAKIGVTSLWGPGFSRMASIYDKLSGVSIQHHHSIGVVASNRLFPTGGAPVDETVFMDIDTGISATSRANDANARSGLITALSTTAALLEGSAAQQANSGHNNLSAPTRIAWGQTEPADDNNRWAYLADSSNWTWVQTQLLADYYGAGAPPNPGSCLPCNFGAPDYISGGYSVVIPRSSNLGPADAYQTGSGIIAYKSDQSAAANVALQLESFAVKGGGGGLFNAPGGIPQPTDFVTKQYDFRSKLIDVDASTGTATIRLPPSITVGSGAFPYSLSYQKTYRYGPSGSSGDNLTNKLTITGSSQNALGITTPFAAAEAIAAFRATLYLHSGTFTGVDKLERIVAGAMANNWWNQRLQVNTVSVISGADSQEFIRAPDNSYISPPGEASTLSYTGTILNDGRDFHGLTYKLTDPHKVVSTYTFHRNPNDTLNPHCSTYIPLGSITEGGDHWLDTIVYPYGMTVTYSYVYPSTYSCSARPSAVANSLGRTLTIDASGNVSDGTRTVTAGLDPLGLPLPRIGSLDHTGTNDKPFLGVFFPTDTLIPSLQFTTDDFGRVTSLSDPGGARTDFLYASNRLTTVLDGLGYPAAHYYDDQSKEIRTVDRLGRVTSRAYDGQRRLVQLIRPDLDEDDYTYDTHHNLTQTTRNSKPGSGLADIITSATYNQACNLPSAEIDERGKETDYTTDTTKCLTLTKTQPRPVSGAARPVWTYTYSSIGLLATQTDPLGVLSTLDYDSYGNLTQAVTDSGAGKLNITVGMGYSDAYRGDMTSFTDARGNSHSALYDLDRRITTYNGPLGISTQWVYDNDSMITSVKRLLTAPSTYVTTSYTYYGSGRVKTMTDPDGKITKYFYDANNRPWQTVDPEGRTGQTEYDAEGRVLSEFRGIGSSDQQIYLTNAYGIDGKATQRSSVMDANGNVTGYDYDGFNRLITTSFPSPTTAGQTNSADTEVDTLDAANNVLNHKTRKGDYVINTYDNLNRVLTRTTRLGSLSGTIERTITYGYDQVGRILSETDTLSHALTSVFDNAGRLTSTTIGGPQWSGTKTVSYQYDAGSNRTRLTWPDSYYVQYCYDALSRMSSAAENGDAACTTGVQASYGYDLLSRRSSLSDGGTAATAYTYSSAGDLLTLAHDLSGTTDDVTATLLYTAAHKMRSQTLSNTSYQFVPTNGTKTYTPNGLNQYTAAAGATLGYDSNGSLTNDGTWIYGYDADNRLTSAAKTGTTASYAYDPRGRRVQKTVNGTATLFLLDGDTEIAEYDNSGALTLRYIPGPAIDDVVAQVTAAGVRSYPHVNRQGSAISLSDTTATKVEGPYLYDAYGNGAPATGYAFKYAGRRLDPETGLYFYRARYYSNTLGRFLQTDPVGYGPDLNWYAYVGNDPANKTDPTGGDPTLDMVMDSLNTSGMQMNGVSPQQIQQTRAAYNQAQVRASAATIGTAATLVALRFGGGKAVFGGLLSVAGYSAGQKATDQPMTTSGVATAFGAGAVGSVAPGGILGQIGVAGAGNALGQLSQTGQMQPDQSGVSMVSTLIVEGILAPVGLEKTPGLVQAGANFIKATASTTIENGLQKALQPPTTGSSATCDLKKAGGTCQVH